MAACYRHPNRETNVSCSACGKPICPSCMTPTSVGMRCPDCAGERTQVRTAATIRSASSGNTATIALIVINAIVFLASGKFGFGSSSGGGTKVFVEGVLFGPSVADGEYWRLVTSGFLHANLWHIGLNMYLLWILGGMLEPAIGKVRFLVVYFTALLGGSFGALLLSPLSPTVGASGAIFGLMGATAVVMHRRGINIFEAGIGGLILINLVFSFFFPGISVGGHLGGLLAGALAMLAIHEADRLRRPVWGFVGAGLIAVIMVAASIVVADASLHSGYTGF